MNAKKNRRTGQTINRLFLLMILIYVIMLLIISAIACWYSYQEKKRQILSSVNMTMSYMEQEYADILDNFWQAYMPIYEKNSAISPIFQEYFTFSETEDLSPVQKRDLSEALQQMKTRDSRIQWIGLYSPHRQFNYLQKSGSTGVEILVEAFPYYKELLEASSVMEIHHTEIMDNGTGTAHMFAISGNAPVEMGPGRIIIGYSLNEFQRSADSSLSGLTSERFYLTAGEQLIFDSSGSYDTDTIVFPEKEGKGSVTSGGKRLYVESAMAGNNRSFVSCSMSRLEILRRSHRDTPLILSITIVFTLLALLVHNLMNRSVAKEVAVIKEGLDQIAENNLEYRLPTQFKQSGLPEIAHNINEMSFRLNEHIQKSYYFELKQKDAQLAELQATFNPHFLYNTLEMLRSKSYSNGDMETSALISQLSALFRGFINAKTFITIREELAFSNRYFSLLNARYGNSVKVQYNIPGELLDYGIIRNVFQLTIENYFVHGFRAGRDGDNLIRFTGESVDEASMLFCVEDNGIGMSSQEMEQLNKKIEEPIRHGEKSYGLKNLNQRLKLFYGPDFGLHVFPGNGCGLRVEIRIRKLTVAEYEAEKDSLPLP